MKSRTPEGRARHSVRAAAAWPWANGAQGTNAPYRAGWFMATMRDFEIVEPLYESERRDAFHRCVRNLKVGMRSTASATCDAKKRTRWNAFLPSGSWSKCLRKTEGGYP